MVLQGYTDTARALASPTDERRPYTDDDLPLNERNSSSEASNYRDRMMSTADKLQRTTISSYRRALDTYQSMSVLQRAGLVGAGILSLLIFILFLKFGESVFFWIAPLAKSLRDLRNGWMILWAFTFIVSFPPLIGYSSCVTIAGFVYGVRIGWLIVATATVLGSTASFLASRTLLSSWVSRLIANDRRFAALALTLKHDGLKLLVMIRLCPLPYSISNGAIATVPTVSWPTFMLASALASPKLLIHVFVGSRLAAIAGDAEEGKDGREDWLLNWASVGASMTFGAATAWVIYRQTKRRAEQLELEEVQQGRGGHARGPSDGGLAHPDQFDEDLDLEDNAGRNGNGTKGGRGRYAEDDEDDEDDALPTIPQIRVERFHDDSD